MSSRPLSPIRIAWYKWKALHLPWRKRFLVGLDLQGNTFWEFRDTLSSHKNRMRRIVKYPPTVQYSDLDISPSWHQWLRHTRQDPPSITEQSQDVIRQQNLKVLAAQADARWAAKSSYLEAPVNAMGQQLPVSRGGDTPLARGAEIIGRRNDTGGRKKDTAKSLDPLMSNSTAEEKEAENEVAKQDITPEQSQINGTSGQKHKGREVEDPWKKARGGPSEEWQPKAWDGSFTAAKRQ